MVRIRRLVLNTGALRAKKDILKSNFSYLLDFSGTLLVTVLGVFTESADGLEALEGRTILRISFFCFSASIISAL